MRSAVILWAPSSLPTTAVTATLPVTSGRPESSVSDSSPSSRSRTRWATLLMCPTHVGVATTRMSASISRARMPGHASPSPMSTSTPGLTSWSTTGRRRRSRRARRAARAPDGPELAAGRRGRGLEAADEGQGAERRGFRSCAVRCPAMHGSYTSPADGGHEAERAFLQLNQPLPDHRDRIPVLQPRRDLRPCPARARQVRADVGADGVAVAPASPTRLAVKSETLSPGCAVWQSRHIAAVRLDMRVSAARSAMPTGAPRPRSPDSRAAGPSDRASPAGPAPTSRRSRTPSAARAPWPRPGKVRRTSGAPAAR